MPFEFETHPAIRFVLVQSPERSELIILCHHIICDGISLAYLARDLMVHLGEPAREVEVLPAPRPIDLDNLPGDVSQPGLVKFLIGRMNRTWAKEAVFFDQEDYQCGPSVLAGVLNFYGIHVLPEKIERFKIFSKKLV